MNSYELAHRFFHEPDKRGEYARVNTSFTYYKYNDGHESRRYYSFSTCIAEIRKNKKGELCLLISNERYSACTSKHLYELARACPFDHNHIFRVPRVGNGFYNETLKGTYDFERVLKNISMMTEKDLRRQENRTYVSNFINLYDAYAAAFKDTNRNEKRLRKSAKVLKAIDIAAEKQQALNEKRVVWAAKREERIAERERKRQEAMAAARERLEKYFNEGDKLAKLQLIFQRHYWEEELTEEMREFRNMLYSAGDDQGRRLSYVWLEDDHAQTSQHCTAPISDVARLLHLWKRHENMIGEHAGVYTVVENKPDYVKIGCHVIPKWNIELLCNKLNIAA